MVKNLPAMQKTRVHSLGWEDLLEKGMATHSSVLAWENPWTEESGGLQSMGSQESGMTERLNHHSTYKSSSTQNCRAPSDRGKHRDPRISRTNYFTQLSAALIKQFG